jgi:hypothetical protein
MFTVVHKYFTDKTGRTILLEYVDASYTHGINQLIAPAGFKPVSLLATTKFVRAAPGGTGGYKLGAK